MGLQKTLLDVRQRRQLLLQLPLSTVPVDTTPTVIMGTVWSLAVEVGAVTIITMELEALQKEVVPQEEGKMVVLGEVAVRFQTVQEVTIPIVIMECAQ